MKWTVQKLRISISVLNEKYRGKKSLQDQICASISQKYMSFLKTSRYSTRRLICSKIFSKVENQTPYKQLPLFSFLAEIDSEEK